MSQEWFSVPSFPAALPEPPGPLPTRAGGLPEVPPFGIRTPYTTAPLPRPSHEVLALFCLFPFCKRLSIYEIFLNSTAPVVESSALSSLISCVTIGAILVVFILKLKQFPPEVMGMDFGMFNFHA